MGLAKLPKIDRILDDERLAGLQRTLGRRAVTAIARQVVARFRESVRSGQPAPAEAAVLAEIEREAGRRLASGLSAVINATGVILHTNLGRAPLSKAAIQRIADTAGSYSNLELDVELGVRTRRGVRVERGLAELVGAEDALVVNNNAAAVLLCLSTLAADRSVVVSRGELVEIGGGFRIPEVLARSGARLAEVGTTNRTSVDDYARAIDDSTACLLRVHPSNFKISGFAERPQLGLAELARARGIPMVKDLGGGLVVELPETIAAQDRAREPSVQQCVKAGADLVCFSLDKLFGGPQGGAVVGRAALVQRLREDPMARALRVDKLTLAALEPMLDAYAQSDLDAVPIQRLLRTSVAALEERVGRWLRALGDAAVTARLIRTEAAIGGGTLADAGIASVALALTCPDAEAVALALRSGDPPVLARIEHNQVILDARSVFPEEDPSLVAALGRALGVDTLALDAG